MGLFETTGEWSVALGKTLVHSLWIGYLMLFILRLVLHSLSSHLSLLRYRISSLMLFLFTGLVIALFFAIYIPDIQPDPSKSQVLGFIAILNPGRTNPASAAGSSAEWFFYLLCCYCYVTGVMVMLLRTLLFFRQARRLKKSGVAVEEVWHARFNRLKERVGVKSGVALLASYRIRTPAVVGLIKPMILVPLGMFSQLSVQQVETILLHELYHFKRRDFVMNLIQLFLENLFFYHPAVWALSGIIRTEREHCCDDLVLQSCKDPFHYASALTQLAGSQYVMNSLVTGAGGQDHYQLLNRIRRIFNLKIMKTNLREKLYALMFLAGGLLILLTVSGFTSGFSIIRNHELAEGALTVPAFTGAEQDQINSIWKLDTILLSNQEARKEAMESIDWEALKKEMEEARKEAMESIDMEAMKKALDSIDWESMRKGIERSMEEFDWDQIRKEIEQSTEDIDWEKIKEDIERTMQEIDWKKYREEMEKIKIHMDSVLKDMDI